MKKRVFATIFVLIFAFLLCGCTASVGYKVGYYPTEDGVYGISQSVMVTVDKASIVGANKTKTDFVNNFNTLGSDYILILKQAFNYQCEIAQDEEDENGYCQKVRNLAGDEATVQKLKDYVAVHMLDTTYETVENEKYVGVSITQKFDTILAYRCFWKMIDSTSDGTDEDDGEIVDETFFQKTVYTQNTVFNGLSEENFENLDEVTKAIVTNIKEFFNNQYDLSNRDLAYTFTLASPAAHFYTDADYIETDEYGNKVYTWEFSSSDLKKQNGDQITTYTVKHRASSWYKLAIYLTIIVGVGLILFATIKEKDKNNSQQNKF